MALVDALAVPNPQVVDTFGQPGVDGECTHSHGLDLVAWRAQALPKSQIIMIIITRIMR